MIEVDVRDYQDRHARPFSLDNNIFYHEVSIPHTAELERAADKAVDVLEQDGFTPDEAVETVGLHIQAAASFAHSVSSQAELLTRVIDSPTGPALGEHSQYDTTINPSQAVAIAGFLPHVAPYDFDSDTWIQAIARTPEGWSVIHSALRWLEVWQTNVSSDTRAHALLHWARIEEGMVGSHIAQYSSKLRRELANDPGIVDQLMDLIMVDERLPLFGELGLAIPEAREIWELMPDKTHTCLPAIQQVGHVDFFAGDCPTMDWGHSATLLQRNDHAPEVYGNAVLVSVQGQLVGSIKFEGEQSMLALRTITDEAGKMPLVIGGVYVPRREVVEQASRAYAQYGKWAHIERDSLLVRPSRFLGVTDSDELHNLMDSIPAITAIREALELPRQSN